MTEKTIWDSRNKESGQFLMMIIQFHTIVLSKVGTVIIPETKRNETNDNVLLMCILTITIHCNTICTDFISVFLVFSKKIHFYS